MVEKEDRASVGVGVMLKVTNVLVSVVVREGCISVVGINTVVVGAMLVSIRVIVSDNRMVVRVG